jgi:geranylgeranyl diphosphate synthase type II
LKDQCLKPETKALLGEYASAVEGRLEALLPRGGPWEEIEKAMAYGLLGGGKRIRAALLLGAFAMFAEDWRPALNHAAAIEMLHAYSLIHDDLPCMDNDDTRRGKPSCHRAFGEATALLAGDALLTLAFETLTRPDNAFGAEKALAAAQILAKAAGAAGMVGGQALDLKYEARQQEATPETLALIDRHKTGALIRAACLMGAQLGGADAKTAEKLGRYAEKLGLAFQIRDDILDITGDPAKLGKPTGSDAAREKATYATLLGIEAAGKMAKGLTEGACAALDGIAQDTAFLRGLAAMLDSRNT